MQLFHHRATEQAPYKPSVKQNLEAINDWQCGGIAATKYKRGQELKKRSECLPDRFRQIHEPCYRQMKLTRTLMFDLGERLRLPESISGWTVSPLVAKAFKDGLPQPGRFGIIFRLCPNASQVVINLPTLYADNEFKQACATIGSQVVGFENGIGKYGDSQNEVVLEVANVAIDEVYAIGVRVPIPPAQVLASEILGRPFSQDELQDFERDSAHARGLPGDWWLTDNAKDLLVANWKSNGKRLGPVRKQERRQRSPRPR